MDIRDTVRVLGGDRSNRRQSVHAERSECFQVGLNTGAANGVAAGNRERAWRSQQRASLLSEDQEILIRKKLVLFDQLQSGGGRLGDDDAWRHALY